MLENVAILILFWVLAGLEGTGGGLSRVFNLALAHGTSGFGADSTMAVHWQTGGPSKEPRFLHLGSLSTSVGCLL